MITVKEAAEKWGVSVRFVQMLCREGRITGATQWGRSWMIPRGAAYPCGNAGAGMPMPRKSPFLDMTDLYTEAGTADACAAALAGNPEAQALFEAEIAYSRGNIDEVITRAHYFLNSHSGFYAINAGGMLLALAAIWRGDIYLYREAKIHICGAPAKNDTDRDIISLALACIDSAVRDVSSYPDWFRRGKFEYLPPESHPAAKVFYVKYLLICAQEMAMGRYEFPDVTGMGLMRAIPYIAEPLIARVVAERVVIPQIYLRLLVAVAYHQLGDDAEAIPHIDKAIALALPDGLLGILVEHRRNLDTLLDDRLALADEQAYSKFKVLQKAFLDGWTRLHNSLLSRSVSSALTTRQKEICRLAAFGLSDNDIAGRLKISVSHVKKELYISKNKTGAENRRELGAYV